MDSDNPFSPGEASDNRVRNDGGTLEPVAMDPMAILGRCWEILVANPGTVAGAVLLPLIPAFILSGLQQVVQIVGEEQAGGDENMQLAVAGVVLLISLVSALVNLFFQLGAMRIFTRLARGLPAEISMLTGEAHHYLGAVLATILLSVAVMVGFLLLIIPGIILSLGLQFTLYALVDQDLDPIAALQESWRLTDGYKVTVFLVNLVIALLMFVLICATLGIGYLIAVPMLTLSQAVMYHALVHLKGNPELSP